MKIIERDPGILNFRNPAFSAGQKTIRHSGEPATDSKDENWLTSPLHEHLFLASLYALEIPKCSNVHVCFALPFQWAKKKSDEVIKHYTREWELLTDKNLYKWNVQTKTDSQGKLAFLNTCIDFDKVITDPRKVNACIADIGGETLDIITIRDGLISRNMSGSPRGFGIKSVIDALQSAVERQYDIPPLSYSVYETALKERNLVYDGKPIGNIPTIIDTLLMELAERVYRKIQNVNKNLALMENLFITGGTGRLISPYLQIKNPRFQLLEQPFYANALGALKFAEGFGLSGVVNVGLDIGYSYVKAATIKDKAVNVISFESLTASYVDFETLGV